MGTQTRRSKVVDAVFLPGGLGKRTKIRWNERNPHSIFKEGKTARIKHNQKFQIATATAVGSDLLCFEKRLEYWYKSDEKVKEAVNNVVSTSTTDTPDRDIVVKNLQDFVQDHSKSCNGGGTRTKEDQHAVELVLTAANWSEQLESKKNASLFGITINFAKKIVNMAKSRVTKSKRKTRKDTILLILRPHVYKFCHDDFISRVETGGKTARNFVKVVDLDGNIVEHSKRVWSWATTKEKFNQFLASKYYAQFVEELTRNPYFGDKFDKFILEAEKQLRRALDRDEDDKLTNKFMLEELEARGVVAKKNSNWAVIVTLLYRTMFDDPLTETDVAAAEIEFVSITAFLKCLCPCVGNPVMESCVDIKLNQVMIYSRSLGEALTRNKRIKEAFAQCKCENCKLFRDKNDKQATLNDLLGSFMNTYKLIEYTCCGAVYIPQFKTEQDTSTPRLIPRNCTKPEKVCEYCGVDKKFAGVKDCPVWKSSGIIVKTREYQQMERSGTNSNDTQRTVLELVPVKYTLSKAVTKLLDKLRDARVHLSDTMWANRRINNGQNSVSILRVGVNLDYAASMDLHAIYKQNCHENAHVANLVMIAHWNPQWVLVDMPDGAVKRHYVRENWAIHSFFDTISRGKKTDALGIRYSLIEMLVLLFEHVLRKDPEWTLERHFFLELLEIASDNAKNQNKCVKHFYNMAKLCLDVAPRLVVMYLKHRKKVQEQPPELQVELPSEDPSLVPTEAVSFFSEPVDEEAAHNDTWFREIKETDPYIGAYMRERERQIELEYGQALPAEEDEEQRLIRRASYVESLSISDIGACGIERDFGQALPAKEDDEKRLASCVESLSISGEEAAWETLMDSYDRSSSYDDSTCATSDDDESTCATSDFLDCLHPSKAEYMVGAQTVHEINERFVDRLPENWFERLSFDIRHVYSEPDQGKGEHDGEGGTNKRLCYNGELSGKRSPNATGVFMTLTERLGQKLGIKQIGKFHKYAERSDPRLLNIAPATITNRVYMTFLEEHLAVLKLREEGYGHAHYIERKKPIVDGAVTVEGTDNFKEVFFPKHQPKANGGVFELWSSTLGCPCNSCLICFNSPDCEFKSLRTTTKHEMKRKSVSANPSPRERGTTKRPGDPPQVQAALMKLCNKYKKSKLTVADLIDLITKDLGLPKPTPSEKKLKKFLVKIAFDASFPNETPLFVEEGDPETTSVVEGPEPTMGGAAIGDDGCIHNDDDSVDDSYAEEVLAQVGNLSLGVAQVSLENFGNTCYLNALIQLLSSSQQILNLFGMAALRSLEERGLENVHLFSELSKMVVLLNCSGSQNMSARLLLKLFFNFYAMAHNNPDNFALQSQHDPMHFFTSFLECLGQECQQQNNDFAANVASSLLDLFAVVREETDPVGQIQRISNTGLYVTVPDDDSETNVKLAVEKYLAASNVKVKIWPDVLLIVLDRSVDVDHVVNTTKVKFGDSITIGDSPCYKLRGVINRTGIDARTGHYTAHVKRAMTNTINRNASPWIHCDDSSCVTVEANQVIGEASQRTVRVLLYEIELEDKMQEFFYHVNGGDLAQMVELNAQQRVYSNQELESMDLRSLSIDQLVRQLLARNVPITTTVFGLPVCTIDSLVSQLYHYL
jgi:hypothetical protein